MSKQFSFTALDKISNKTHTYDGYLEEKENYFRVYIRDKADYISFFLGKGEDPDKSAVMTNAIQPEGITNNMMMKASLKYLFGQFPFLTKVEFRDGVSENGIFITPKRLLFDQPGWYEEHFGAIQHYRSHFAMSSFKRDLKLMKKDIHQITNMIVDISWGKLEDYKEEFVHLLQTWWFITKNKTEEYIIDIDIKEKQEIPEWLINANYIIDENEKFEKKCIILQSRWYHKKREMRENS